MNLAAPEGFSVSGRDEILVVDRKLREKVVASGLDRVATWRARIEGGERRSGRGSTVEFALESGPRIRLKQLRRGGLLEKLWRERFVGTTRLLDNVSVPLIARSRGVATPAPVALLMVPGPPGFFRAWIAFEELVGAIDISALMLARSPFSQGDREVVMSVVRKMHDAGIEHRDLNLGNLMLRRGAGATEAFVIDLDRARSFNQPLEIHKRRRALQRLDRSWMKVCGGDSNWIFESYAADDPRLRQQLSLQ